jgi:PAS domain S-box-containing protein
MDSSPTYIELENQIAELKKQNEILRLDSSIQKEEEREYYSSKTLNYISDPVFIKDDQSRLLIVNDAFCKLFGYSRVDIIGKTLAEDVPPEEWESFLKIDKEVIGGGVKNINEELITVRGDETRTISTRKTRFINSEGKKFLVGIIQDITERKKNEVALRNERLKLKSIFDAMQDGVCITSKECNIEYVNPVLIADLGSYEGRKCYEYFHGRATVCDWCKNEEVLKGNIVRWEFDSKANGKIYDLIDTPLINADGSISKLEIFRDVTERKATEQALIDSELRWKFAVEGNSDGLWDWDLITNEVFFSEQWKKMLGFSVDEISGSIEEWDKRVHPDDKKKVYEDINKYLAGITDCYENEHRVLCKNNTYKYILDRGKIISYTIDNKPSRMIGIHSDISAKKQAEEKLKESELKYKDLVETADIAILIDDEDGFFKYFNNKFCQIFGYTEKEIDQLSIHNLVHPDDVDFVMGHHNNRIKGAEVKVKYEFRGVCKNRKTVHLMTSVVPIKSNGKNIGTRSYIWDITERKLLEAVLFENKLRNEKSQALGHVGNWEYNIESKLLWVSDESKRIYGFDLDSNNFTLEQTESCIPERERVHQALIDLIDHDKKYDLEFEIIPTDKTPRKIIHSIAELEKDASNNPLRVRGVILDITKQKQVEKELNESKEKFANAQAIAHLGHWELDIINNKLTWSDEIYKMFDLDSHEFNATYETFLDYIHPDDRDMVNAAYSNSLQNKTNYEIEHRLLLKSGIIKYVQEKCNSEYNVNGEPIRSLGTVLDITELKEAEFALKELNATKDKLFSIIAHDLRSPFTGILGFSELLIENLNNFDDVETVAYLKIINSSAKSTLVLLDNLLSWAKTQTGQITFNPKKINLSSITSETIELSKTIAIGKHISISQIKPDDIEVYADKDMLKTVLRNLISNAIKFTKSGGKISVSVRKDESYVEIAVSDNGLGMNDETINKLFRIETNYTTTGTEDEKGSGLGLILCKDLVEKQGGKIGVESELGKGSIFKFTLPMTNI